MSQLDYLREWAAATFGAHSHQEGQVLAALGPLEEWLAHLGKYGVHLNVVPKGSGMEGAGAQATPSDPPYEFSAPVGEPYTPNEPVEVPLPDPSGFIFDSNPQPQVDP